MVRTWIKKCLKNEHRTMDFYKTVFSQRCLTVAITVASLFLLFQLAPFPLIKKARLLHWVVFFS